MAHLIGDQQVDRFTVLDSEGLKVLGETFTADAVYDPDDGDFVFGIGELGDGLYELVYTQHKAGTYYLRVVGDTTGQVYEFNNRTDGYEQGDTVKSYFTVRDEDGAYHPGSFMSVDESYAPDGLTFAPGIEDLGLGLYRATWVGALAGVYTVRLSADLSDVGDEDQLFELEERVLPSTQDEETPFSSVAGSSLDDLIRRVALECRDYLDTEATSDSDAREWVDELTLVARSPKMFKGASFFVRMAASSENIGEEARVIDSIDSTYRVILSPTLPSPIRRRDRGYFTNLESTGFARQTYKHQINARIADSFPNCLRPAVWTFDTRMDPSSPYLTPPWQFTHLYMVSYPCGSYDGAVDIEIPYTDVNQAGWWWDDGNDRIVLQGGFLGEAGGCYMTIRGYGRWEELESDEEVTGIDSQWLVQMTAGHMILSTRDPRRQSEAAMHLNRADGYLPKAISQLPPNTIRIR